MTDYTELIHALRYCANRDRPDCSVCEYEAASSCKDILKLDAAAAIEELQAEIRESMQKCAECSKWNEPLQVGKAGNQFTLNATEPPQEES